MQRQLRLATESRPTKEPAMQRSRSLTRCKGSRRVDSNAQPALADRQIIRSASSSLLR